MGGRGKLNVSELFWTIDETWRLAIYARLQCWNESASSQLLECARIPLYPTEKAGLKLQKLTSFSWKWIHTADETGRCSNPHTQTLYVDRCNVYTSFCLLFLIPLQPSITGGQAVFQQLGDDSVLQLHCWDKGRHFKDISMLETDLHAGDVQKRNTNKTWVMTYSRGWHFKGSGRTPNFSPLKFLPFIRVYESSQSCCAPCSSWAVKY